MAGLFEKLFAPELALERQLRLFAERELAARVEDVSQLKANLRAFRVRQDQLINQLLELAGAKPISTREALVAPKPTDTTIKLDKSEEEALYQRAVEYAEQKYGENCSQAEIQAALEHMKENPDHWLSDI